MILAVSGLVIAAFVLALDGSTVYTRRRSAQTAADAGMLAGIQALRVSDSDAYVYNTIGEYVTNHNGATSFVAYYTPGGTQVGSTGAIPSSASGISVTAFITFPLTFGPAVGIDQASVGASAAGDLTERYSLFAFDESCDDTINWTGGGYDIGGAVHSNNSIRIGSSGNSVRDKVTYVTSLTESGNNNSYAAHQSYVKSWPVSYDVDRYRTLAQQGTLHSGNLRIQSHNTTLVGPYYIDGDFVITAKDVTLSGLFFVTGDVRFTGIRMEGTFTVVSEGEITTNGGYEDVYPYIDDLMLLSNHQGSSPCDQAISVTGSHSNWRGKIYAPRGGVKFSSSQTSALDGSIWANTIWLTGSNATITWSVIRGTFTMTQ